MPSPPATVPSSSCDVHTQICSSLISNESPSTSNSSLSLLDTSQNSNSSLNRHQLSNSSQWTNSFDRFCQWTSKTLKVARQIVNERIGKTSRTLDFQLEEQIQNFYQTRIDCENLWKQSRQMVKQFIMVLQIQRSIYQSLVEIDQSTKSTDEELTAQLKINQFSQQILIENGQRLLQSLNQFLDGLETLVTKTMEDTLNTVNAYENSRIEYDAYRNDYELVLTRNHTGGVTLTSREEQIEQKYYLSKTRFEKYQSDLYVKLKLLNENRIKVLKSQLNGFHQSILTYFEQTNLQIRANHS